MNGKIIHRDGLPSHNPALIVIEKKGYKITVDEDKNGSIGFWYARNENSEFVAGDPLSLLGLISIWETSQDLFNYQSNLDRYDAILEECFPD